MTTVTADAIAHQSVSTTESSPLHRLRMVLMINAATSFAGGAVGLATAPWLSEELGFNHVALTRILSIGLMVFALDVAMLARARAGRTVRWSAAVSVGDFTWVVATIGLIATGTLTTAGVVVAIALGLGVLDFGLLQLWFRGRARV